MVESERDRLLRQWWNEPGDYSWVVDFFRLRGFMTALRASTGLGGVVTAIALGCLQFENLIQPRTLVHALIMGMTLASIGWAVYWWWFPWPTARQAAALFALTDVGVAIATALHADPLAALSTTPLFAMPGAFIVFFYGPRANAVHMAFATVTIVSAATWLAVSGRPDAVPLAISKALIALTVTVGTFPFVQFGFWLVRSNSIESLTDPLTDLANRRGLSNYLASRVNRLTSSLEPLCAFVIDLDGFKKINDEYGHKIGDAVITRTAERIRLAVGPSAFVARTGGEEFVVVDLLELSAAAATAEGIRAAVEALETPKATASIGIAVGAISDVSEFDAIHACADEAMYAAKRSGGNRIALGGAADEASPGRRHDEIHFRPTQSDDVLARDPMLSTDGS
ncbi:MAG TPA: GGDEF domain-containing protein [Mycobacterium sp.]